MLCLLTVRDIYDYMKSMPLTKKDLQAIQELMEVSVENVVERKLEEKLKYLPTRDEFFERMDALAGELKLIQRGVSVIGCEVHQCARLI